MNEIVSGTLSRNTATKDTLAQMLPIYDKLKMIEEGWVKTMKKYIDSNPGLKKIDMTEKSAGSNPNSIPRINACRCPCCQEPAMIRYSPRN